MMLLDRKLKARQSADPATIAVYQDSSAADADATAGHKYDDAFHLGALPAGKVRDIDRDFIDLGEMTKSYDGPASWKLGIRGAHAWKNDDTNSMTWQPNTIVEFFATLPTVNAAVATPAWHTNAGTPGTQVRLFYGKVTDVTASPDLGLDVTIQDPTAAANDIKFERDTQNGITIPKIAFNLPREHPDFFYCIKVVDAASAQPLGTGETNEEDYRATVGQILGYLQQQYNDVLIAQDILDPAYNGNLFAAEDLALLAIKPAAMVLENEGFADGVREILRKWAPHVRMVVDHQTTQWRIVQYGPSLTDVYANGTSSYGNFPGVGYASRGNVDTPAMFSPGMRVRLFGGGTVARPAYVLSQEKTVHSVVGNTVNFVETATWAFMVFKAYPLSTAAMPTLEVSIDDVQPGSVTTRTGGEDSYSAVNLWSVYQVTETRNDAWNRDTYGSTVLQPGWDPGYEGVWMDKDSDRTRDYGPDGQGMKPYAIGNDGTNDYFQISYAQSQFGQNHANNEWKGCSLWIWTVDGANVRSLKRTYTVKSQTHVADVGDGTPGLRVIIQAIVGQILIDSPGFKPISDASATEDRIAITHNYNFKTTTGNNKRWEVGRKFYYASTTIQLDQDASPHVSNCQIAQITAINGDGADRKSHGLAPNLGHPASNTGPAGPWETLATGGIGATHVWRRATYTHTPVGQPCAGGAGWQPPLLLEVEAETTTIVLRNARYPSAGYAGPASAMFGLERVLNIAVEHWADDLATPDYEGLALRLWQIYSRAQHQGEVTKPGLVENAVWLDLSVAMSLTSSRTTGSETDAATGSSIGGFWGHLTSCTLNFASDEVVFNFDNKDRVKGIDVETYEEFGLRPKNQIADLTAYSRAIKQLADCLKSSQRNEAPTAMCGDRIYYRDGTNINIKITAASGKPQQESGASDSGVGWA